MTRRAPVALDLEAARRRSVMTEHERLALLASVAFAASAVQPRRFVEVGTKRAGTSALILREIAAAAPGVPHELIGVDSATAASLWWSRYMPHRHEGVLAVFWKKSSVAAAHAMKGVSVSWLFLDACHCRACVEADLRAWAPLILPGGLLVLHDTAPALNTDEPPRVPHDQSRGYGVRSAASLLPSLGLSLLSSVEDRNGLEVWQRGHASDKLQARKENE